MLLIELIQNTSSINVNALIRHLQLNSFCFNHIHIHIYFVYRGQFIKGEENRDKIYLRTNNFNTTNGIQRENDY